MRKSIFATVLLGLLLADFAQAALPVIDRTDKVHSRRYLDSLNVYNRRSIRVNQSGFRPQDYKYAYVADPKEMTFKVIDANTGKEVSGGGNLSLIKKGVVKPGIHVNGAFNSLKENQLYKFGDTTGTATEDLYRADFTTLNTQGEYYLVVGSDTSATFHVHPSIYNAILENSLQFFGIQRCGDTKSHFHKPCHLKDGSKIKHDLTGGWHDCGDHFKVSETLGYAAYVLSMVYLTYQNKAEDRYGNSYADTVFTDGIPDVLYEAHIGTDYILKLYEASKADGLLAKGNMYHSVGVSQADHEYWDVPEKQDAQLPAKGGPDRVVLDDIGSNVAGMFIAALANVSVGYRPFDPVYSDSLLKVAQDMYAKVLMPSFDKYAEAGSPGRNTYFPGFYTGGGPLYDDGAAAALALWYATGDTTYRYDLYKNPKLNDNSTNYQFNLEYFKGGFLGHTSGFTPGGWASDYQNIHSYVLFAFKKLILDDDVNSTELYGLTPQERDSLNLRVMYTFHKVINDATNDGDSVVVHNPHTAGDPHASDSYLHVISPYNLLWVSFDWGVVRYNLGTAVAVFLMYEITKDERYLKVALDNMYYALGANPWDISLLMGAGDKNPQHPHNRAANPDGYNAGGMPYQYRCPKGALMGGREPTKPLVEDWETFVSTETCIDFSAQFLFPAQSLAETLPIDAEGPLYTNIVGTPITDTSAIISWNSNEVALTTVFYNTMRDKATAKSVKQDKASKDGALTLNGLTPGQTYYFYLEGIDTQRNMSSDDNHGQWYTFTMKTVMTTISGVTICQVDHRSAKIYWWSSDRMNGVVNYGTTTALGQTQAADGGAVLFHEATLTNLEAGKTYYFSVSSGATTDDNGGAFYSFTTEEHAIYANLDIYVKPSSYGSEASCSSWQDCSGFILSIANNDTMPFENFEVRLYLKDPNLSALGNCHQNFGGDGQMGKAISVTFGTAQPDGFGGYYLPINVTGVLEVSGQLIIQTILHDYNPSVKTAKYSDLEGSWSLRPHTGEDDPEYFEGIDLTQAPYFKGSETTFIERNSKGEKVVAFTRDPYIAVYYHGRHIYGYGPDYTPESGPMTPKTVTLEFASPFVTPYYSVEKEDYQTSYQGSSKVTPTGILDDLEMNGVSQFSHTLYDPANRKDAFVFGLDTTLVYGNNYMEWVSWHNHGANINGSYDCACAIMRTNVEIDTITAPPEERYLQFTVDTITAYTGKKAEVHVQLLDSTLSLITTERITIQLSSENGLAKYFTSSDATIAGDDGFNIDIVNGEAVFYVSSDVATETLLRAIGPNTSKVHYNNNPAVLIIQDLPPWPIIDFAKMVDMDCNGIPDAIQITLSNEYIADQQQSFNSVKYVYGNDTLVSTTVISQNGKELVVAASISDTTMNTSPSGSITLVSNIAGKQETSSDFYQDGIAPRLISASVLEKLDTATSDRVYLQFSEAIQAPGLTWPTKVLPNDRGITVKAAKIYNDSLNIWEYEIEFGAGGSSLITEGMEVQLLSTSGIRDLAGNEVGECTPEILPVLLKIRPVPMTYASISDPNEDGIADQVNITFSQAVDTKHTPDNISVIFGSALPETLWVKGSNLSFDDSKTKGTLKLNPTFALGNTNGTYEGVVNGKNLVGAGFVMQHLGTGASYESNSILAEDKVGPIFISASVQSASFVTSNMNFSEPVSMIDSTKVFFLRERDDLFAKKTDLYKWTFKPTVFSVIDTSDNFIMDGDRVRLAPLTQSAFIDQSGNSPATNNPWVTVGGEGDPKITFNVYIRDHLSKINTAKGDATPNDPTMMLYIVNPSTQTLDAIDPKTGKVLKQGIDTTVTPLTGAVWVFDLTVPRGSGLGENAAWDTLKVSYDLPIYTNLGSFVNRLSEDFSIPSSKYLSSTNKVTLMVEWTNVPGMGVRSQNGRAVGTGAYIYKAEIKTKFVPNADKDEKTRERFSSGDSYDKTKIFGIKRYNATN